MENLSNLLAAVDLGSNSFRLIVARIEKSAAGCLIYPLDQHKESIRFASGLDEMRMVSDVAIHRANLTLERFAERIRAFDAAQVRAVATNTFRVAKNLQKFLPTMESILGFPIEIINGREEARLIYLGVAHDFSSQSEKRLVIDIGGGSTELIIGQGYQPILMESLYMGCVNYSLNFFSDGELNQKNLNRAVIAARKEMQFIAKQYYQTGWQTVVGSSGTAKALLEISEAYGFTENVLTLDSMYQIEKLLLEQKNISIMKLKSIKADRLPVLPGGYAILRALFEELEIEQMQVSESGLRQGVLYDLLGRAEHKDMREITIEQFMHRYAVDQSQAKRVAQLSGLLYQQLLEKDKIIKNYVMQQLQWAACLHEVGFSIAHESYHKHSAYIVENADMPGFSRQEQVFLANVIMAHAGKLIKIMHLFSNSAEWEIILVLRLALIFYRNRIDNDLPALVFSRGVTGYHLNIDSSWLAAHPLTEYGLFQEITEWSKVGINLKLND